MMYGNRCIAVVIVIGLVIAVLVWTYYSRESARLSRMEEMPMPKGAVNDPGVYSELRLQALNTQPSQFEITSSGPIEVYGVVMDWDVGTGSVTVVSFLSGDASFYTSTGGGVIGGIGHQNVRDAAVALVQKSKSYLSKLNRSDDVSLPGEQSVKFFILTTKGRFVSEENLANFDNGSSSLLELFVTANEVITQLRKVTPDE